MIDEVSLGITNGTEYRVVTVPQEDIEWLLEQLANKTDPTVGDVYKIYQVVAYGDPTKISEIDCARYIQSTLRRAPGSTTFSKFYYCEATIKAGYSKDPFTIFTSARAAWNSAIQLMNNPEQVILVAITKPEEDGNNNNSNTEVHKGSSSI